MNNFIHRAGRRFNVLARPRGVVVALLAASVFLGACASQTADVQVAATGLQFPEGPVFVGDTLYFVDYAASSVSRLAGGKKVELVWHQDDCGANGLAPVPGGLLVACYESGTVVRISLDGKVQETIRADDGRPFLCPNDLTPDAHGGVYFSASGSESELGKVYYRNADGRVREVAANIHYSNGLAVSPDGRTLYLAESEASRLLAFPIELDGQLGPQSEFIKFADILSVPGERTFTPDGVRVDKQGNLFVGLYRGGGIAVISRDAKLLKFVKLPGAHHANLALAPDHRTIFVTSADDRPDGSYLGELLAVPNPIGE